jgi:hypothetical protein
MYTVGAKTADVDAFETPALVQTVDGGYVPASHVTYSQPLRPVALAPAPAAAPVRTRRVAPVQTVYRPAEVQVVEAAPVQERVVVREPVQERVVVREPAREEVVERDDRSWQKTAMIIGGTAASGAGIGGIAKGKKGAIIGAAIGGGAASIYEATRRR